MKIEQLPIDELVPYARNSRTHDEAQVAQIAASIQEFGFTNPILIDAEGVIIAGHGRVLAAKKLELSEVPCIRLDYLTETQRRAYVIADNKLAMNAGWNNEMLSLEIKELLADTFDLSLLGFSKSELESFKEVTPGLTDEDDVPEVKAKAVTAYGDTWVLGSHRVMCGDSTVESDVKKIVEHFQDVTRHCISDPPYGIAYEPGSSKYGMIKNDDVFLDYIGLAKKYTDGFFFMWTSYQVVDEWITRVKQEFEKITNMIVWHKGGGGLGDCLKTLATDFEIALVVNRGNHIQSGRSGAVWDHQKEKRREFLKSCKKDDLVKVLDNIIEGETLWQIKKDGTNTYLHPTQKPVELNRRALESFTRKGDAVIDLFLGSGSNLIACEALGRKMGGMELDPRYVDVIVRRWQEFTGQQATHAESGMSFNHAAALRAEAVVQAA
jgi:DNA modification methylase